MRLSIPPYLLQKSDTKETVSPPTESRKQVLPYSELTWENFERLCKSLVEIDSELQACKQYGGQGHRQHGIDLIAFPKDLGDKRPRVYQCKRVEQYTAAKIKQAVKKFLDNISILRRKWRTTPSRFVLCCRCSLNHPKCVDEIIRQRNVLAEKGISFETWDEGELSRRLKDHPSLVCDFFDSAWVKAFNGVEPALVLSQQIEPTPTQRIRIDDTFVSRLVTKDLEIQALTSALENELSQQCKIIREDFTKGNEQKALLTIQSYLDRFDSDLHSVSQALRAQFWYTAGVLRWKLDVMRPETQACLQKAHQIDPSLDVRDLSARLLVTEGKVDEALQTLEPLDTQRVTTFKLALLLDLRRLEAFDSLWENAPFDHDDVAYELLAYRQRLERRFTEAINSIQVSLERSPDIPAHMLAAGHICFWSAVPEHLDKTPRSIPPAWIHPFFYAPTASQVPYLEEAVRYYLRACDLIREAGPQEAYRVRQIEELILLCYAYHPLQRMQAQELATRLLSADPTVFTALFYCLEWDIPFDLDQSIQGLEAKRGNGSANPNDVFVLTQLYERNGKLQEAIELLERDKPRFVAAREDDLWLEQMSRLYARAGHPDQALLSSTINQDPAYAVRLEALRYELAGKDDEVERSALKAWTLSGSLIDLMNLCGFYRKREQWDKLKPLANQLVTLSPDPRNLWYLVESLYRTRDNERCLETIEERRSVWLDPSVLEHIRRIEVECLIRLNRLDSAVVQLEAIRRERPTPDVIQRLAQAYFRLGRRENAVTVLREAVSKSDADSRILMSTSQLLLSENPEEAFRLAQRAAESAPQDPSARIFFIEAGFLTGHDREALESMQTFREQFPTSTALQSVGISDALKRMASQQKARQDRWSLYRKGEAPVHVLMDIERQSLGLDWYGRFESNLKTTIWNTKLPIYARHGNRGVLPNIELKGVKTIVIDYTSLLLCHKLGLLQIIEQAFERILLPPSMLLLIQGESLRAKQYQISRLAVGQVLRAALDSGTMQVLGERPSDDALDHFQLSQLGRADSLLFYLAKKEGAVVLVLHLAKEPFGPVELREELEQIRVSARELLAAMVEIGALGKSELGALEMPLLGQPLREDRIGLIIKLSSVVMDVETAEWFTHHGLLNRLAQTFKLAIPKEEVDHLTFTMAEFRLRREASEWLEDLANHLTTKFNVRYFFPSVALPEPQKPGQDLCTVVLEELFNTARIESCPLWSDDRMVNRYDNAENQSIVTIDGLLSFLHSAGVLSVSKFHELLLNLLQLNVLFLPVHPGLITKHLRDAGMLANGHLRESYELKTIRRYVTSLFSQGTALNPLPLEAGKSSEVAAYFHYHRETCRRVLIDLWIDETNVREHRNAASQWVVERLWKGLEDLAHFDNPSIEAETLITISHSFLIGIGFVMMFNDLSRRGESAAEYLTWLYETYLEPHWHSNPQIRQQVLVKVREVIVNVIEGEVGERRNLCIGLFSHVLATTLDEFSSLILLGEKVKKLFEEWVKPNVVIGTVKIPIKEWDQWAFDSITAGTNTKREVVFGDKNFIVQWCEQSSFIAGLGLLQRGNDGLMGGLIHSDPFLKLRHPDVEIRKQALQAVIPYLGLSEEANRALSASAGSKNEADELVRQVKEHAENSWRYFWERLRQMVIFQLEINESMAFPSDPEVFNQWLTIPPLAPEQPFANEFTKAIEQTIRFRGEQVAIDQVLGLPVSGCFNSSTPLGNILGVGREQNQSIISGILERTKRSSNPLFLLNSLDALLGLPDRDEAIEREIKVILRKLLAPAESSEFPQLASSYKLYIVALRFAWSRMENLEAYSSYPSIQRMFWAYAYATKLTDLADDMRDSNEYEMDRDTLAEWMEARIERRLRTTFEDTYESCLEVSHPLSMTQFRIVVSGTLRVLAEHKNDLVNLGDEIIPLVSKTVKSIVQGKTEGWEIFQPFKTSHNCFKAAWGSNAMASLKQLFDSALSNSLSCLSTDDAELLGTALLFDPKSLLEQCLNHVITSRVWSSGDLTTAYLTLSEPTDTEQAAKIGVAITTLDLTSYHERKDFQLGCAVLARAAASTRDIEVKQKALSKLAEAWSSKPRDLSGYGAIIDAAIQICARTQDLPAFYRWWENALNISQGEILDELQNMVAHLAWNSPISFQSGLPSIRAKLGMR